MDHPNPDAASGGALRVAGRIPGTGAVVTVETRRGRITAVREGAQESDLGDGSHWLSPGFLDLQLNGYGGADFNLDAWAAPGEAPEPVDHVFNSAARAGTPLLCPTITTNSRERIVAALERLCRRMGESREIDDAVLGFHVEGPYISPEDGPRGAHPRPHVRPPDWDEFQRFQEAAEGRIRILTLAPEISGALPFIERVAETGVVVALGHTGASPQVIRDAVRAGARLSTHLGNGCSATIHRHESFLWEQMATDDLTASLILDGHHLPPAAARCIVRAKGPERVVLVSDAVSLGGLPPGRYLGDRFEVLPGGKVVVPGTPYLAGAGHLLDVCVAHAARVLGVGLGTVIDWVTAVPARLLGLADRKGSLRVGSDADMTLFDLPEAGPLRVRAVVRAGRVVYRASSGDWG